VFSATDMCACLCGWFGFWLLAFGFSLFLPTRAWQQRYLGWVGGSFLTARFISEMRNGRPLRQIPRPPRLAASPAPILRRAGLEKAFFSRPTHRTHGRRRYAANQEPSAWQKVPQPLTELLLPLGSPSTQPPKFLWTTGDGSLTPAYG
jgi:hypothetical protein